MKGIYKIIKKEIQGSIKRIAERRGIGPMNVLTSTDGEIFSEFMTELEALVKRMYEEFEVTSVMFWECFEGFQGEIVEFICPDYVCTAGDGYIAYLNRRLIEEGYTTVDADRLSFLLEEFESTKTGT